MSVISASASPIERADGALCLCTRFPNRAKATNFSRADTDQRRKKKMFSPDAGRGWETCTKEEGLFPEQEAEAASTLRAGRGRLRHWQFTFSIECSSLSSAALSSAKAVCVCLSLNTCFALTITHSSRRVVTPRPTPSS